MWLAEKGLQMETKMVCRWCKAEGAAHGDVCLDWRACEKRLDAGLAPTMPPVQTREQLASLIAMYERWLYENITAPDYARVSVLEALGAARNMITLVGDTEAALAYLIANPRAAQVSK